MTSAPETLQLAADKDLQEIQTKKKKQSVEEAVQFWCSPSLAGVSADDKLVYLKKKGFDEAEIHQMWDHIMQAPSLPSSSTLLPQPQAYYPQQQQQQATTQHSFFDDQNSMSHHIPALLTVGGLLGLTAAASVRWLNGGDFSLFPPPTKEKEIIVDEHQTRTLLQDKEYTDDEDNDQTEEESRTCFDLIQTRLSQQETLLQRLVDRSDKELTDKSMALLHDRKSGDTNQHTQMNIQLVALYNRMDGFKLKLHRNLALEMEELLDDLDNCIQLTGKDHPSEKKSNVPLQSAICKTNSSDSLTMTDSTSTLAKEKAEVLISHSTDPLSHAIRKLATENDTLALKAGAQLLYLYVLNLSSHPHVPRYRKIHTSNESFQKVETLMGGKELLSAVDFKQEQGMLVWNPGEHNDQSIKKLMEAAAALNILKSATINQDKTSLAMSALAALSPEPIELNRSNTLVAALALSPHEGFGYDGLETPQMNVLDSPPSNKGDLRLPINFGTGREMMEDSLHASPVSAEP